MQNTKIEWTDATWNPVRGCSRVSDGCRNCYAETVAGRFKNKGQPYEGLIAKGGQWNGQIKLLPEKLLEPWHMIKPRRIFVNSTSDLFHEQVPFEFIAAVFWIMSVTTRHTYQVLTKRPQRMLAFFQWLNDGFPLFDQHSAWPMSTAIMDNAAKVPTIRNLAWEPCTKTRGGYDNCGPRFPYENVWLGTSIEDQATADERIPHLLATPAAVRFISAEPLLGPVELQRSRHFLKCAHGHEGTARATYGCNPVLDWVIVGGESGPNARPMHPDWARSLRDQCTAAGVPFFFKQWGEWEICSADNGHHDHDMTRNGAAWLHDDGVTTSPSSHRDDGHPACSAYAMIRVGKKKAGRTLDGRTWDEYPEAANG